MTPTIASWLCETLRPQRFTAPSPLPGYSGRMDWTVPRIEPEPEQDPSHKPRRSSRLPVEATAGMRSQERYRVEIRMRNVSSGGFMAESAVPVGIGSYVSLDVPGVGPVHAQVRWQLGAKMGGMFLDPISLTRCEWTAVRAEPGEIDG